jgi:hypothetical protein
VDEGIGLGLADDGLRRVQPASLGEETASDEGVSADPSFSDVELRVVEASSGPSSGLVFNSSMTFSESSSSLQRLNSNNEDDDEQSPDRDSLLQEQEDEDEEGRAPVVKFHQGDDAESTARSSPSASLSSSTAVTLAADVGAVAATPSDDISDQYKVYFYEPKVGS